jgi:hypothetical protein
MGKKIIISESQLERLAKLIAEAVSGYDDIDTMIMHGGHSMILLHETGKDLLKVLQGMRIMLNDGDISSVDLKENITAANDLIGEIVKIMEIVLNDFSEKLTIEKGEILIDKLKSFTNRTRPLLRFGDEDLNKKQVINKVTKLVNDLFDDFLSYYQELLKTHTTFKNRIDKFRPQARPEDN